MSISSNEFSQFKAIKKAGKIYLLQLIFITMPSPFPLERDLGIGGLLFMRFFAAYS